MFRRFDSRKIGIGFIVLGTLAILALPFTRHLIVQIVERYFSADQHMTPGGIRMLTNLLLMGLVGVNAAGYALVKLDNPAWRTKITQVFMVEPLTQARLKFSPKKVLLITTLAGLVIMLVRLIAYRNRTVYLLFFWKDRGLFDLMVPASMLLSAVLLGITARRLWLANGSRNTSRLLPLLYLGVLAACVFYAGEETSWGQDFFRWQTPELFSGNLESQTNLHNYLNPYFHYFYMMLAVVPVVVLASAWMEYSQRWLWWKRMIFPHPALIGLGLLIGLMALVWTEEQEVIEEMVALFLLFYSIRVFSVFRAMEKERGLSSL